MYAKLYINIKTIYYITYIYDDNNIYTILI